MKINWYRLSTTIYNLNTGSKIERIKYLRDTVMFTDGDKLGLKAANDIVELYSDGTTWITPVTPEEFNTLAQGIFDAAEQLHNSERDYFAIPICEAHRSPKDNVYPDYDSMKYGVTFFNTEATPVCDGFDYKTQFFSDKNEAIACLETSNESGYLSYEIGFTTREEVTLYVNKFKQHLQN